MGRDRKWEVVWRINDIVEEQTGFRDLFSPGDRFQIVRVDFGSNVARYKLVQLSGDKQRMWDGMLVEFPIGTSLVTRDELINNNNTQVPSGVFPLESWRDNLPAQDKKDYRTVCKAVSSFVGNQMEKLDGTQQHHRIFMWHVVGVVKSNTPALSTPLLCIRVIAQQVDTTTSSVTAAQGDIAMSGATVAEVGVAASSAAATQGGIAHADPD